MKILPFTVAFCCFLVFLLGSALFVYIQMNAVGSLELTMLENRLYKENTDILAWSMKTMDPEKLTEAPLPGSWGEVLIVDNASLLIKNSTNQGHAGKNLHSVPQLLDEAGLIIEAMKKPTRKPLQTDKYMVAVSPLSRDRTLIGFKPRSWEKGLVSQQTTQIKKSVDSFRTVLIVYLAIGVVLTLVFPLVIVFIASIPLKRTSTAFEQLSLGDFNAELPPSGGKAMASLSDSFFRLKTSLKMALEKLGSR